MNSQIQNLSYATKVTQTKKKLFHSTCLHLFLGVLQTGLCCISVLDRKIKLYQRQFKNGRALAALYYDDDLQYTKAYAFFLLTAKKLLIENVCFRVLKKTVSSFIYLRVLIFDTIMIFRIKIVQFTIILKF